MQDIATIPNCELTPTGLYIKPGLPFQDWQTLLQDLQALKMQKERECEMITWWLADAIIYGETEYGEKYAQAIEDTGLSSQRLQNIVWVGNKFQISRRREMPITFEHHAKVAALPAPDADALLDQAETEGWSTRQLYNARLDREAENGGKDADEARAERALTKACNALQELSEETQRRLVNEHLIYPLWNTKI